MISAPFRGRRRPSPGHPPAFVVPGLAIASNRVVSER
jgi:hypothetical protein